MVYGNSYSMVNYMVVNYLSIWSQIYIYILTQIYCSKYIYNIEYRYIVYVHIINIYIKINICGIYLYIYIYS